MRHDGSAVHTGADGAAPLCAACTGERRFTAAVIVAMKERRFTSGGGGGGRGGSTCCSDFHLTRHVTSSTAVSAAAGQKGEHDPLPVRSERETLERKVGRRVLLAGVLAGGDMPGDVPIASSELCGRDVPGTGLLIYPLRRGHEFIKPHPLYRLNQKC